MYLSEFRVFNYKSFVDSGPIVLKPGINVLTGQNNAGKTALLEALSLEFADKTHLGLVKSSSSGSYLPMYSHAFFRLALTQDELREVLPHGQSGIAFFPVLKSDFPGVDQGEGIFVSNGEQLWSAISARQEIQFDFVWAGHKNNGQPVPAYSLSSEEGTCDYQFVVLEKTPNGSVPRLWSRGPLNPAGQNIPIKPIQMSNGHVRRALSTGPDATSSIGSGFQSHIYGFRAERMNIAVSAFGRREDLQSDASNLPEVLHVLQSNNPARFRRYNGLVKRVFPQVEWVSVSPVADRNVEILVWSVDPESERADLAFSLSESGTGISQVLAMLYVLVTAESPRTILIDEPNSFLHPGAVRALVEILREHPQHQYILSTHSPELIAASNPSTIHILRRSQGVTQVESVDTQEARNFRTLLMEVGSRPSDVFGAENVLWVEGPTEQLCFPLIARHFLRRPLAGVSIVGVLHTGDFDAKKDTRSVFRIYERLTQGSALLPPAVAFIFDREIRPDKDRQDLERQSKGKVHFLSRRTYENYLLHAGAIAAVMNEHPPFTESPTDAGKVQAWLDAHVRKPEYYGKAKSQDFPQDIDAPKLLDDLFQEFSENRLTYNKVEHSLELTEWLLANAPEALKEIGDLLARVLPAPAQAHPPSMT